MEENLHKAQVDYELAKVSKDKDLARYIQALVQLAYAYRGKNENAKADELYNEAVELDTSPEFKDGNARGVWGY